MPGGYCRGRSSIHSTLQSWKYALSSKEATHAWWILSREIKYSLNPSVLEVCSVFQRSNTCVVDTVRGDQVFTQPFSLGNMLCLPKKQHMCGGYCPQREIRCSLSTSGSWVDQSSFSTRGTTQMWRKLSG